MNRLKVLHMPRHALPVGPRVASAMRRWPRMATSLPTSLHITPHSTSLHITPHHTTSHHITPHHTTSHHITPHHSTFWDAMTRLAACADMCGQSTSGLRDVERHRVFWIFGKSPKTGELGRTLPRQERKRANDCKPEPFRAFQSFGDSDFSRWQMSRCVTSATFFHPS